MKLMNYMNLNQYPVQISFLKDRTEEFTEVYHAHQGMEFLYVHQGRGQVVVDRQIFELAPGSLFYFRPFQLHRVRLAGLPGHAYVRSLFVFEPAVVEEALQAFPSLQSFIKTLWKDPPVLLTLSEAELGGLGNWIVDYSRLLEHGPAERQLEEQLFFLCAFLHRIRSGWPAGDKTALLPRRSPTTAEQMMEWLEEHYTEPFELDKLAQTVHLTPNHVSSLFHHSVGSTITEYITARRIRQACWLLRTTDLTVKDTGEAVGYPNFSYFCKVFKKHTGISPYQFKKEALP